jgi:RNA polymerase sigma factor (sigma-70 family)
VRRGFLPGDLTFAPRLSTVLFVEPEIDCHAAGGDNDQIATYVRRAQAGDAEGYKQLFRLHVRRLHRLVYRLAGPGCDVEDLVQTIFVQAFASLPGFRGDAAFFTWLGRIAVRITLRLSKQSRYRPLPRPLSRDDEQDAGVGISPEGASDARRALVRFDAILGSLSDKRRAAFVLHVLQWRLCLTPRSAPSRFGCTTRAWKSSGRRAAIPTLPATCNGRPGHERV